MADEGVNSDDVNKWTHIRIRVNTYEKIVNIKKKEKKPIHEIVDLAMFLLEREVGKDTNDVLQND